MESQQTTIRGVPLRWEEAGQGFPVVLTHGIPTSPTLWRHVVPLVDGARCLAFEMVGRLSLERMREIDTVLFDKTGTLTKGEHAVTGVAAAAGLDEESVVALAAAVEADSEHPLARAIVAAAKERGVDVPTAEEFAAQAGRGVQATVDGARVAVGGPALLREQDVSPPGQLEEDAATWRERGAAVLYVVRDGEAIGALAVEDQIRPESREAVERLHALGKRVVLITGDARRWPRRSRASWGSMRCSPRCCPRTRTPPSPSCRIGASVSPWSATV